MPTIKIDYTSNLKIDSQINNFASKLHKLLVEIIKTDIDTCRTLINRYDHFLVGDQTSKYNAFIQLEANILPGRSAELRKELGNILLKELKELCREVNIKPDFRVLIQETNTEFYFGLEH